MLMQLIFLSYACLTYKIFNIIIIILQKNIKLDSLQHNVENV